MVGNSFRVLCGRLIFKIVGGPTRRNNSFDIQRSEKGKLDITILQNCRMILDLQLLQKRASQTEEDAKINPYDISNNPYYFELVAEDFARLFPKHPNPSPTRTDYNCVRCLYLTPNCISPTFRKANQSSCICRDCNVSPGKEAEIQSACYYI